MRATALFTLVGLAVLVAMVALSFWMLERTRVATEDVLSSRGQRSALVDLLATVQDAETGQRGFLLTGEDRYLEPYEQALKELGPALEKLRSALALNSDPQAFLLELKPKIDAKLAEIAETVSLKKAGKADEALAVVLTDRGKVIMDEIRAQISHKQAEVENRLFAGIDSQRASAERLRWSILGGGILIILAALGTAWAITAYTRELVQARSEVEMLNTGLELRVRERTADLQRANDEIQRFAYIVSHDLRAPLVNVMGFTSELQASLEALQPLVSDPAIATHPAGAAATAAVTVDVPEAISFIRMSTKKMDGLINAILKLSREGQRTLNPEFVDLGALFDGISGSVQHRLTETEGTLNVARPLATIVSDRLALEQIFGNLVDNALKYRSPDRAPVINVRMARLNGSIQVDIEDNGRGIGEQDYERVFDLFRRAGSQDQPGEGIGLAHVRALVRRLGGQISLTSELGVGTTFRIKLPRNLKIKSEHAGELRG
jgi:signal transduction histidine kinase